MVETSRDQRAALEAHFASLVPLSGFAVPSCLFELSTSANEELARAVLHGRQWERSTEPSPRFAFFRAAVREHLKWAAIRLLAIASRRWSHSAARRHLAAADAVLIGHCRLAEGRLDPQNFSGFSETVLRGKRLAILSLKLPNVTYRDYFHAKADCGVPLEAFVRMGDVRWALARLAVFFRALRSTKRDTIGELHAIRDLLTGRPVATLAIVRAASRILERHAPRHSVAVIPMERHDWELLLTARLSASGRQIWAVQNCTFSPNDLNMYVPPRAAPEYRRAQPNRLFAMSRTWESVFRRLGLTCDIELLTANRFSGSSYPVQLLSGHPRILYVGSINRRKVARDLEVLASLPAPYEVEARLHPSLRDIKLPPPIVPSKGITGPYNCIVYADTSMVFQFECDRSRLFYLDYPDLVNQDPAGFVAGWPGRTIRIDGTESLPAALGQLAAAS